MSEHEYTVGQRCFGKITEISDGDIVVELVGGVKGVVPNGVSAVPDATVGKMLRGTVKSISGACIILTAETVSEGGKPESAASAGGWGGWATMAVGHRQMTTAFSQLYSHTVSFIDRLKAARAEWEEAKKRSQGIYDSDIRSADSQYDKECASHIEICRNDIESTQKRKNAFSSVITESDNFSIGVRGYGIVPTPAIADAAAEAKKKVFDALAERIRLAEQLRESRKADSERARNDKHEKARKAQLVRDSQAERSYQAKHSSFSDEARSDFASGFSTGALTAYSRHVKGSRFNAENYECPKEVPEYVLMGEMGIQLPNGSPDEMTVIQAVDAQTNGISRNSGGGYEVRLPYAQRLSDGISLLIRYSPADRDRAQKMMQPLLLNMFMSFPAGKLEATMIDPLQLGASFPDIPKLASGPNSARIIDTKIWSGEHDIDNAIATLRQRLENMTQAYGTDTESRLKKEVLRALVITDFPTNFNDSALKNLHAIVRNSAALGVMVFICTNMEELEKLRKRNGNLVDEILRCLVDTKAMGNRLVLQGAGANGAFIELDDMRDVMANKDKILTIMREAIEHSQLKIEKFEAMYPFDIYDSNNWFMGNHDEIAVPIGIKGADTVVKMVLGRGGGSTEHHALIAGQTGAGKSTMLHTLIMSTMVSYSPDEVQMYLLDFKEGVEFAQYTRYRLPSLRVVAINSEREFGLNVLKELCTELETRTKHFTRYGVSDINAYYKLDDAPKVPKLLLIFDEVQELFRDSGHDNITADCLSCLNKLVMQGRAMGIHVILACQDFHNCSGLEAYFSQMAIRIAVKGSEDGASSILNPDNEGIRTLQNQAAGAAIYNGGGGVESANNFFQISYMSEKERKDLLEAMHEYYTYPGIESVYENYQTRVLLTNAEDNIHNCFNQLIYYGPSTIEPLGKKSDGYGLLLGQGFGKRSIFMPELRARDRDNLLIVTRNEKMALSLFELAAMSVLYEELHTTADKANALVYIVDLFADELPEEDCDFDHFEDCFGRQLKVAKIGDTEDLISDLYDTVMARAEGSQPCSERIFLMFFGLNRAKRLRTGKMYDDSDAELTPLDKLQFIFRKGAKYGVNSIVWSESLDSTRSMLGDGFDIMFNKRIAFELDAKSMDELVSETDVASLRGHTAVYMDINTDIKNTHFRPYEVPAKVWVSEYARTYQAIVDEQG